MSFLGSFSGDINVAVVGAAGGIGGALVQRLQEDENVATVHALTRAAGYSVNGKVWHCSVEITKEATIKNAAERISASQPLDLVIVATGLLHRGSELKPEKSMRELDANTLQEVFAINAVGPALVAKHLLPHMRRDVR